MSDKHPFSAQIIVGLYGVAINDLDDPSYFDLKQENTDLHKQLKELQAAIA
jgi:hypothetical protein